jgi:tRNA-2-methylthio-N6-dimethylallyladenosine synthase
VHFAAGSLLVAPESSFEPVETTTPHIRPGDVVEVEVTYAAPHHLVADGPVLTHRRTRSGDAWEARTATPTTAVGLGMPSVGAPA